MHSGEVEGLYQGIHAIIYKKTDWRNGWTLKIPDIYNKYPRKNKLPCGIPFSETVARAIDSLLERIEGKKASCIFIDGGVGEGKTTLQKHIINYCQKEIQHPSKTIGLGGKEFMKLAEEVYKDRRNSIGYDEAGDFSKRATLSKFNAMLNRFFETYRAYRILVIIALPDFSVLDSQIFRNKIPRLLLHCYGRRAGKYGKIKAFDLEGMNRIRFYMNRFPYSPHKSYNYVEPIFTGVFKDLPIKEARDLEEYSIKGKLEILKSAHKDLSKYYDIDGLITKTNRSRSWVLNMLRKYKIKHTDRVGRRQYWDINTLERLKELSDKAK